MEVAESEEADLSPEWEVLGQLAAEPGAGGAWGGARILVQKVRRLRDRQSQDPREKAWGEESI